MERRQIDELAKRGLDVGVKLHRGAEALAAVDDAVADRLGRRHPGDGVAYRVDVDRTPLDGDVRRRDDLVRLADQSELDAARSRVDDEDPQVSGYAGSPPVTRSAASAPGQIQSRTSGGSSPTSRV